jgi:hypothetical protein
MRPVPADGIGCSRYGIQELLYIKNREGHPMVSFILVIGFWTIVHMKH